MCYQLTHYYLFAFYVCYSHTITFFLEPDCNECATKFVQNGGCDCLNNESCDAKTLIPEGCAPCEDKVNIEEYCLFTTGKCVVITFLL